MKFKCVIKTDKGAVKTIVRDFESIEMAYVEFEGMGNRVFSIFTLNEVSEDEQ